MVRTPRKHPEDIIAAPMPLASNTNLSRFGGVSKLQSGARESPSEILSRTKDPLLNPGIKLGPYEIDPPTSARSNSNGWAGARGSHFADRRY